MKPTNPAKELRELREDVKEIGSIRDRFKTDLESATKANLSLNARRMAMYESLQAERLELQSRLIRIESRIRLLDIETPRKPEGR